MKTIYALLFILVFINFSCKKTAARNLDKNKVKREILEMFENYHNAIKKGGLQAEFEYLDSSSDFFWVPPGYKSALSYDSVKSILTSNAKTIKSIEFSWDTIKLFILNETIANYSGIVNGEMIDTTDHHSTFKIIESGTLIKRKSGWKLLNGQSRNLNKKDSLQL